MGFTVHPDKSVLVPTQKISFLGFELNSVNMTIRLTPERAKNLLQLCRFVSRQTVITILEFAKLIGKMVASEPGVQFASLYYKELEHIKDKKLKELSGNFDAKMAVCDVIKMNLDWWIGNIKNSYKNITKPDPSIIIHSDGSGAVNNMTGIKTEGKWSVEEIEKHINYLELKAAYLALQKLLGNEENTHVRIYMDNTVAVTYINNYGGRIETLHKLTQQLWFWTIDKNLLLSTAHVPGTDNFEADSLSRNFNDDMEWMLKPSYFYKLNKNLVRLKLICLHHI